MHTKTNKLVKFVEKRDLINKNQLKNINSLPAINKIILHFGCKTSNLLKISKHALALELITGSQCRFHKASKNNSNIKLKKNTITGVSVVLKNSKLNEFLSVFSNKIFPKLQTNAGFSKDKFLKFSANFTFSLQKQTLFLFDELEFNRMLFNDLEKLIIVVVFTKKLSKPIQKFLLNNFLQK